MDKTVKTNQKLKKKKAKSEKPTKYFLDMLKQSADDIKKGRVTSFSTAEEAIKYVDTLIKD